ncbi:hypothetical protein V6N13_069713 [Hibiscus sabdariffa]
MRFCLTHGNPQAYSISSPLILSDKPLHTLTYLTHKSPNSFHVQRISPPKKMASVCASSAMAAVAISSPSSQKTGTVVGATKASFLTGKKLRSVRKYSKRAAASTVPVCAVADPDRPLWFPGSVPPPWLDGSLPGDFGFDPLGLGSDPETLRWNVQAELVHCRNTSPTPRPLFIVELIFIGWAEGRRWADILKPGCVNTDPIFPNNKLTGTDVGYPGGLWFDPLGWGSGSPEKIKELRTKEIKNGRLAMLAVMGAWFQHIYTGTGPIDNLFAHLADPGHATIFAAFTPK